MTEFFQILESSTAAYVGLCIVLGLLVGSFLNVVIHRVPKMLQKSWQQQCDELAGIEHKPSATYNLFKPRSSCPRCNSPIGMLDNIPLLSYLILRGKCRNCGASISLRYPAIETASGLLCGFAAWHFGFGMQSAGAMLLVFALLALTAIDIDTQLLPDNITLPLIWLGMLFNLNGTYVALPSALLGAVFGYLSLWSIYWLFKLLTGKEGMGYGDFKLLSALGAWLGWQMLPLVILLSSLVGATAGIALIVAARRGRDIPIPFGPYLAGGGLIALFWGHALTESYLQLFAQ
jgi:leader peptidase (prepilin peptidase)/N-methyltransferase